MSGRRYSRFPAGEIYMGTTIYQNHRQSSLLAFCTSLFLASMIIGSTPALGQQASVSTWDAASLRNWSFIPYWTSQSQLESFSPSGIYDHVSDILYFSGVRPQANGNLNYHPWAAQHLTTLNSHQSTHGFRYHMSMFDTFGGDVETVWNSITANPANRANFISNVTNLLQTNGMTGFNLDWERPNTVTEWANYTQLALELRQAINPLGMEVSVDDFGFSDYQWDDSPVFDANIYDQLFIMGYHYPAYSGNSLNHNSFANFKNNLTGQGPEKAFSDDQLVLGIGTWGKGPAGTKTLKSIIEADPNLAYDATTWTDGTNTWEIESREQVRDKVQLAIDRGMPGVMNWTLHYDSPTQLGLHRVAHHYIAHAKDVPDLNLDGKVDAADANELADNMGTVPGWTGTNTAARFDKFYRRGNWEQGDHNGNGFVNQADADWLAARFTALGVNIPDRLAFSGTFENFANGPEFAGRWEVPMPGGNLPETGNFAQHGAGVLTFTGNGPGADKYSDVALTIRNQNAAEAFDTLNTDPRELSVELATPINLGKDITRYFTMLVKENTAPLLAAQLTGDRDFFLEFLDPNGEVEFDVSLDGLGGAVGINSQADATGDDVSTTGFTSDTTHLLVGRLSGNGAGANTIDLSLFPEGATVGDFTDESFSWMLTAEGSAGYNPLIAGLQMKSLYETNFTVSNVQIGPANHFFSSGVPGDFDVSGATTGLDLLLWQRDPVVGTLAEWESGYATGGLGRADRSRTNERSAVSHLRDASGLP